MPKWHCLQLFTGLSGRSSRWRSSLRCAAWIPHTDNSPPYPRARLLSPLQDLDQPPALGGRQRTGLHQRDAVADAGVAVLVVRLDLLGGPDDLAVQRVAHTVFELDHDGLLHLVADHVADAGLTPTARLRGGRSVLGPLGIAVFRGGRLRSGLRRLRRGGLLRLCHYDSPLSAPSGPDARPS